MMSNSSKFNFPFNDWCIVWLRLLKKTQQHLEMTYPLIVKVTKNTGLKMPYWPLTLSIFNQK